MARIVTISKEIKGEIAAKIVEQATPGYSEGVQGEWYVVNGEAVMHAQENRPWDPWPDGADVISVQELVFLFGGAQDDNADFDPTPADDVSEADAYEAAVMFALDYVPDSYDAEAFEQQYR